MSSALPTPTTRRSRVTAMLSRDATGEMLLLVATIAALVLANTPATSFYDQVRDFTLGHAALHLDLSG